MPRARDDLWRSRLAWWISLSKRQPQAIASLRRLWPLPYQVKAICEGCAKLNLGAADKANRNLLLAILADVVFGKEPRVEGSGLLAGLELQKTKDNVGRPKDRKKENAFVVDCLTAMLIQPVSYETNTIAQRLKNRQNARLFHLDYAGPKPVFKTMPTGSSTLEINIRKVKRELEREIAPFQWSAKRKTKRN
jgi:hypothetical protein